MKKYLILSILMFGSLLVMAQITEETTDNLRKDALRVYMNADEYIKEEIPFINYVRFLKDAQVYIISTSEKTGSGGTKFTYFLEGKNKFTGMIDTVSFTSSPDDTHEIIRRHRVETLKKALIPYVLKTPLARFIEINFTKPIETEVKPDNWNSWVFRTNLQARFSGDKTRKDNRINGRITISRVTEAWKLLFDFYYQDAKNKLDAGNETYTSESNSKSFDGLIIKSISDHWSVGITTEISSSEIANSELSILTTPGIEYNIFPYSESTRRQFNFLYSTGFQYDKYKEVTILNQTKDNSWMHSLSATYSTIEKWGTFNLGAYYENPFKNWSLYQLTFSADVNIRIAKGLFINITGENSFYPTPVYPVELETNSGTPLQIDYERQLSYFTSLGVTYTFGSIYNNVVNPRFRH